MGLIDKDEDVALCLEVLRNLGVQFLDEVVLCLIAGGLLVGPAELVDERADEPLLRLVESGEHVWPALGAVNRLVHTAEDALYLLVKLGAVSYQYDTGVRLVLANPLREPHHD